MKKTKRQRDVPEIRFPGFTDSWEQRKLGDIITEYKETVDSDCTLPILTSSKTEGVILQEEHFGRKQQHDITGYNILPRNYCTYRNRSDGVDFTFNINKCCDKGIISKFYPVFSGRNSDVYFLSLVLNNSEEVVREIAYTCTGTGQKVLSFLDLQKMKVRVPNFDEQKEIAAYFDSLDHLITLHQRELDELKALKKCMLRKMFPKNGEKVPEIRFPGFIGFWEQRKFGDGMDLFTGFPFESEKFSDNGINLIRGMNVKRGYLDLSDNLCKKWKSSEGLEKYLLENEDILIQMDGALIGKSYAKIKESQLPALLVQRVTRARAIPEESNSDFMYQTIQRDFLKYIILNKTDSAVPHLSLNDIREFPIRVPNLEEQKKIGEYLSKLDNLITLQERKCKVLQKLKKCMLQKMLV